MVEKTRFAVKVEPIFSIGFSGKNFEHLSWNRLWRRPRRGMEVRHEQFPRKLHEIGFLWNIVLNLQR
jgi:hypothetical protein